MSRRSARSKSDSDVRRWFDRRQICVPKCRVGRWSGRGLGNAVLFSIGAALRANAGRKVVYFAGYKRAMDRYKVEEIEAAGDVVVWCCDEAPGFRPPGRRTRPSGNIVEAMRAYAEGGLGETAAIPLARSTASSPSDPTA